MPDVLVAPRPVELVDLPVPGRLIDHESHVLLVTAGEERVMDSPCGSPVPRHAGRTPISFSATAGCDVYFSSGAGLVRCQYLSPFSILLP